MDFGKEELPLIIFANWRGFSGGMKGKIVIIKYYLYNILVSNILFL
jgi:hypothetical protein